MKRSVIALEGHELEVEVMAWIADHFVSSEIEIEDFPFFHCGKLVRDKNEETMVVFWCIIYGCVDYRFQEA
ncbi:hypothetical protein D3C79_1092990 [compost metagenome]